jgi:hypothetical protein
MPYIDTKYLFKCQTCRNNIDEHGCTTFCDSGECYSPNLNKIPIADVVEVVHCKDCERSRPMMFDGFYYCNRYRVCKRADDFCSGAKRKGE